MTDCKTDDEITIVIDRLDKCRWSPGLEYEVDGMQMAVHSLLDVVQQDSLRYLKIKILLVMDEAPAKKMPQTFEWARRRGFLDCKVNWYQELEEDGDV
jgi:hypothetical protein